MEYKTSVEVARQFGIGYSALTAYLTRHPHLRPEMRVGMAFLWTDEEVERLAEHRMRPISRGPHAKKGPDSATVGT